jgi:hypothetical protein
MVGGDLCVGEGEEVLQGPAWDRIGPRQKVAMSQVTDAQLKKSEKLAKSQGAGQRDNTD